MDRALDLRGKREFFWDNFVTDDEKTTAQLRTHKPDYKGIIFTYDKPWEGNSISYNNIIKDGNLYRMYYVARHTEGREWDPEAALRICYAESTDGINWIKPNLGLRKYHGSYANNIILDGTDNSLFDNFAVFIDERADTKEKYKGIALQPKSEENAYELWYWVSADGLNFKRKGKITDEGVFDTLNIVHYDPKTKQYVCYIRGFHEKGILNNSNGRTNALINYGIDVQKYDFESCDGKSIRDIRVTYSKDFINWTTPKFLRYKNRYGEESEDYPLYTNHATPYYRGEHIIVGFPTRYVESPDWTANFDRLCGAEQRKWKINRFEKRRGLAVTDCIFMLSRDGEEFVRYDEAFMTPGAERPGNWIYGDCYPSLGFVETKSDFDGADDELSLYLTHDHGTRYGHCTMHRYTIRKDGYVSRHADYKPERIVTKPFVFDGNTLLMNFSTSARGYIFVKLNDENANTIQSCRIFGDSTDRIIDFDGDVSAFSGKTVTMEIILSDAEVYSFMFCRQ